MLDYIIHQKFPKKKNNYIIIFFLWGSIIAFLRNIELYNPSKVTKKGR
jgi:hypothetical protein